jgi:hypothetical protein
LEFEVSHAEYGRLHFAMPESDSLEATADAAHLSQFPYRPIRRFARFRPWADGTFRWNLATGAGGSNLRASFAYQERGVRARIQAGWDRDSLRLSAAEMVTGTSRLDIAGSLDLGGKSLQGLSGVKPAQVAWLRLGVENLLLRDLFALAKGKSPEGFDGVLNGKLEYDPLGGVQGRLEASRIRVEALRDVDIQSAVLTGLGDSLEFALHSISAQQPMLQGRLQASLAGLRTQTPRLGAEIRGGPLSVRLQGAMPEWKEWAGTLDVSGSVPLGPKSGALEGVELRGDLSFPLAAGLDSLLRFDSRRFQLRYSAALDTQWLSGTLRISVARDWHAAI